MNEQRLSTAKNIQRMALLAALAGAVVCGLGLVIDLQQFLRAYLVAWIYWLGLSLGCMTLMLIHNLTGGRWGDASWPAIDSGTRTLWLTVLAGLPVILGRRYIYDVWIGVTGDKILDNKTWWLNEPDFLIRAAVYAVLWLGICYWALAMRRKVVESGDVRRGSRLRRLSGIGLGLYGLAMTFASVDYMMSLEPHWFSTMYGLIVMSGQVLSALALAILFTMWLSSTTGGLPHYPSKRAMGDLGSLLFSFVMLWTYMSFLQFLIIWYADLPEETPWYMRRIDHGWGVVAIVLVLFHFIVPWLLLMSHNIKRNPRAMVYITLGLLAMHWLFEVWMIQPAFDYGAIVPPWMELGATALVGGLWMALFAGRFVKYIDGSITAREEAAQ